MYIDVPTWILKRSFGAPGGEWGDPFKEKGLNIVG